MQLDAIVSLHKFQKRPRFLRLTHVTICSRVTAACFKIDSLLRLNGMPQPGIHFEFVPDVPKWSVGEFRIYLASNHLLPQTP